MLRQRNPTLTLGILRIAPTGDGVHRTVVAAASDALRRQTRVVGVVPDSNHVWARILARVRCRIPTRRSHAGSAAASGVVQQRPQSDLTWLRLAAGGIPADDRIRHGAELEPWFRFGDRALVPRPIRSGATPHDWIVANRIMPTVPPMAIEAIVGICRALARRALRRDAGGFHVVNAVPSRLGATSGAASDATKAAASCDRELTPYSRYTRLR